MSEDLVQAPSITASEAVYGFASWLTCRKEVVTFSSTNDAAPVADLVNAYCNANNLEAPRDEFYPHNLKRPAEQDLIQAPAATDKPSGDHPVSEFEAKAREIAEGGKCVTCGTLCNGYTLCDCERPTWGRVEGEELIARIASALAEAVAAERRACLDEIYCLQMPASGTHSETHWNACIETVVHAIRSRGDVK